MRSLITVTAVAEATTGLALLALPSLVISTLFGGSSHVPATMMVARVTGAALLSLGTACWLARDDQESRAATGLVAALLLYNTVAVAVFVHAGLGVKLTGIGLWPAVVVHAFLGAWCVACLRIKRAQR